MLGLLGSGQGSQIHMWKVDRPKTLFSQLISFHLPQPPIICGKSLAGYNWGWFEAPMG